MCFGITRQVFNCHFIIESVVYIPFISCWLLLFQCAINGIKYDKVQKGTGKNVKVLEMFFSGFPQIVGMENFPNLHVLTLMGQEIKVLENLDCLPQLTELCVSECQLTVSMFINIYSLETKVIFTVVKQIKQSQRKPRICFWVSNRIQTRDLWDTSALLYQLSYEASLEAGQECVLDLRIDSSVGGSNPIGASEFFLGFLNCYCLRISGHFHFYSFSTVHILLYIWFISYTHIIMR